MSETPILFYMPGACSLAAIVVFEYTGRPYRLCRMDHEQLHEDAYLRVNPQGKVPALREGDFVLAENGAVLPRIARGRDDLLPPDGTDERDRANQWMSFLASGFHTAFGPIYGPRRYLADASLDGALKEGARAQIARHMDFLNDRLESRDYVLGAKRTLLDPYLYALSRWTKSLFDVPSRYPAVAAHQARMEATEEVRFALAIEAEGEGRSPSGAFEGHVPVDDATAGLG